LGRHSIGNLCAAAGLALALGVSMEAVAAAISEIEPVPHRLQLLRPANGVTVIDDAYNSSPEGFRAAVGVLSAFTGGRRVVVTPGFSETGKRTREEHRRAGAFAAERADILLALGKGARDLAEGWRTGGGAADGARVLTDLKAAGKWLGQNLKSGDAVLFENDIPDF
jgi:UDP-N-acetylmuramoyl-tripeptide--D-alanyl-D-alanine ligase